jgi:tetratricopeptide (TPR) repeat protein
MGSICSGNRTPSPAGHGGRGTRRGAKLGPVTRCLRVGLAAVGMVVAGCAGSPAPQVERVVGGEKRVQPFVSPYAYEWYLRGELAAARGDLEEAAVALRRARAGPADDPYVIARLAEVLEELGRPAEADAALAAGLELEPRSEAIWLARARIAEGRGATAIALGAYHQAEQAAPRSPEAPLALARMLREQDRPGRANAVLRRFLDRTPTGTTSAHRARLELSLGRGDLQAARRAARDLLAVAPARTGEVLRLVELALDGGDPVTAAELIEAVPPAHRPLPLQVRALVAAGWPQRAEAILATAEGDAIATADLADLYRLAGRADLAEETAEVAILRNGGPDALRAAGQAALTQGQWVRAAERFSRVPPGVAATEAARRGLAESLRAAGLPHVADEVIDD